MNTRSKTRELIQHGEICCNCYKKIDVEFFATWCQANEILCHECIPKKCIDCEKTIELKHKIYVLDGMSCIRPLCDECALKND